MLNSLKILYKFCFIKFQFLNFYAIYLGDFFLFLYAHVSNFSVFILYPIQLFNIILNDFIKIKYNRIINEFYINLKSVNFSYRKILSLYVDKTNLTINQKTHLFHRFTAGNIIKIFCTKRFLSTICLLTKQWSFHFRINLFNISLETQTESLF